MTSEERKAIEEIVSRRVQDPALRDHAIHRIGLVLADSSGGELSLDATLQGMLVDGWLDDGHLHAYAAQAAARELMESWVGILQDDSYTGHNEITKNMITDIEETVRLLNDWKMQLMMRSPAPSAKRGAR